jgi:hypothetical protein
MHHHGAALLSFPPTHSSLSADAGKGTECSPPLLVRAASFPPTHSSLCVVTGKGTGFSPSLLASTVVVFGIAPLHLSSFVSDWGFSFSSALVLPAEPRHPSKGRASARPAV